MRIGVTGPDLIFGKGSVYNHTIFTIKLLQNRHTFILFPDPALFKKFRSNKEYVMEQIEKLESIGINVANGFKDLLDQGAKYKDIIEKYSREYSGTVDLIYSFEYLDNYIIPEDFIFELSRKMKTKFAVSLQGMGDFDLHISNYIRSTLMFSKTPKIPLYRFYHYFNRKILLYKLISSNNLAFIAVINHSYQRNLNLNFPNIEVMNPGNGIQNSLSENITEQREFYKEKKIIYFARLSYGKGLFDILKIMKYIISKDGNVKLIVAGNFEHTEEKNIFFNYLKKYGLQGNVIYKGFLPDKDLYREIATSKVMIYPSHSDSFSIAVSQALALRTPVVVYDIAGLSEYKDMRAVRFVNEFDYESMAVESMKILNMDDVTSLFDYSIDRFLNERTWEKVAEQYDIMFRKYTQK